MKFEEFSGTPLAIDEMLGRKLPSISGAAHEAPIALFGIGMIIAVQVRPERMPFLHRVAFGDPIRARARAFVQAIDTHGAAQPDWKVVLTTGSSPVEAAGETYCLTLVPLGLKLEPEPVSSPLRCRP